MSIDALQLPVDPANPQFVYNNPLLLVAQVMVGMSQGQADYIATLAASVQSLSQRIESLIGPLNELKGDKLTLAASDATGTAVMATSSSFVTGTFGSVPGETFAQYSARVDAKNAALDAMIAKAQQTLATCGLPAANPDTSVSPVVVGGMKVELKTLPAPANTAAYKLTATNGVLDDLISGLQANIDSASSTAQQTQLELQTMMGRFNGTFLNSSSAVKKYETQMQTVNGNLGR